LIESCEIAVCGRAQYKNGQKTAYNDWRDVGRPSNAFAIATFYSCFIQFKIDGQVQSAIWIMIIVFERIALSEIVKNDDCR